MWKLAYVLPNINVSTNIETDNLALVNFEDERIKQIRENQIGASKLLDGFIDDFNEKVEPSVLIYKVDSLEESYEINSVVTFRNIIAITTNLINWCFDYSKGSPSGPLFSNSFDFYPIKFGNDGSLLTINPSTLSLSSIDAPFIAMASREVPSINVNFQDRILFKTLIQIWEDVHYLKKADNLVSRKIFRSLEMAYYALSIPNKNESSQYDYGLIITMWVSAIEILLKPIDKKVSKFDVLKVLKNHGFKDPKLTNEMFEIPANNNEKLKINFIQKLYMIIYNYRSNFIHGDEINESIFDFFNSYPKLSILNIGPNLYRLVLYLFLKENKLLRELEGKEYLDNFGDYVIIKQYEDFFLNVLNK